MKKLFNFHSTIKHFYVLKFFHNSLVALCTKNLYSLSASGAHKFGLTTPKAKICTFRHNASSAMIKIQHMPCLGPTLGLYLVGGVTNDQPFCCCWAKRKIIPGKIALDPQILKLLGVLGQFHGFLENLRSTKYGFTNKKFQIQRWLLVCELVA